MIISNPKAPLCLALLALVFLLIPVHGQTAPLNTQDIGTVAVTGTTTSATGTVTMSGAGTSVGTGSADSCQFGFQTLVGNGTVMTQVQTLASGAVAGVMIRQTMSPGSPEIQVVTNGTTITCTARTTANGTGTTVGTGVAATTPIWLKIVRSGTTFSAYYSTNSVYHYTKAIGTTAATWTLIGSSTISTMSGPTLAGVTQCALTNTLKTSTCGSVVVTPSLLWGAQDVGSVGVAGSTAYGSTGSITINASGASMGGTGTADAFGFAYQTLKGDGTVIARVVGSSGNDSGGLMIRQNATAGSPMIQITRTINHTDVLDARLTQNAAAISEATGTATSPGIYFMLERAGSVFTGYSSYTSASGPWTRLGSPVTISMGTGPVMVGLVECSLVNTVLKTANFDNISVIPFAGQDIGSVGVAGITTYGSGTCTLSGSGTHLGSGSTADAFQFAYQGFSTSGSLITCLNSQAGTDKSGIVFRADTTPGSPMVSLTVAGSTLSFEERTAENGAASVIASETVPDQALYLELSRSGSNYTAFLSTTGPGGPWTQLGGTASVNLVNTTILAGVAECSQSNTTLTSATFSGLTLVQNGGPFTGYVAMGTNTGLTVPSTFMGFSHEWGISAGAQWLMGNEPTGTLNPTGTLTLTNTTYRQLLKNLLAYGSGPINLRIGGDSTDVGTGTVSPITCPPFVQIASAVNVKFELGVNLGANSISLATNQASGYISAMSAVPGSLAALEIGNEPDLYFKNGLRSPTYAIQPDYLNDFANFRNAINPLLPSGLKLCGPAFGSTATLYAGSPTTNIQAFLAANASYLSIASQHFYATNPSNAPVDAMIDPIAGANGATNMASAVTTASGYGLPYRMGEFGTVDDAGAPGVSNAFGSALWTINACFQYAAQGVAGINWETSGNATGAFWFSLNSSGYKLLASDGSQSVNPAYYGMLFFQQATGHGAKLSTPYLNTINSSSSLLAYGTINSSGTPQVTLVNLDETVGGTVSVTEPGYTHATIYRLTASTFQSTAGVTYAGQTFDGSTDGTLQGTQAVETLTGNNGQFEISVPITSAALVVFSP